MKHNHILIFFLICLVFCSTGCLYNYPTTIDTTEKAEEKTEQQRAEEAIEKHIITSFSKLGRYKGYKYGHLYSLKPKEIVELDQLFELKKLLPEMEENYGDKLPQLIADNDSAIVAKKKEIKEKKIYHTFELSHIFKITGQDNVVKLYEYKFTLYPNYKIKNAEQVMYAELTKQEDEMFYYFIMQYPLYETADTYSDNKKNEATYKQFNAALEQEKEHKAELLKSILVMVKYIRINNKFDEERISWILSGKWLHENKKDWKNYKAIAYSTLEPLGIPLENEEGESEMRHIGYKLYHRYSIDNEKGQTMEKAIYFEFDLNFVITGVLDVAPPYDHYFIPKN